MSQPDQTRPSSGETGVMTKDHTRVFGHSSHGDRKGADIFGYDNPRLGRGRTQYGGVGGSPQVIALDYRLSVDSACD
ncbi:MAG: hypothetical protein QM711_09695 [Micropruina sp.]